MKKNKYRKAVFGVTYFINSDGKIEYVISKEKSTGRVGNSRKEKLNDLNLEDGLQKER
jgi:hypothetical protein